MNKSLSLIALAAMAAGADPPPDFQGPDPDSPFPGADMLREWPEYAYVDGKLRLESDMAAAIPLIKRVAEANPLGPEQNLRESEDAPAATGVVPITMGGASASIEVGDLEPWVSLTFSPEGVPTPMRLTYEIRVEESGRRMRKLHIEIDILTPSTHPIMPHDVERDKVQLFKQFQPIVQHFWPLHENVAARIWAADPVPRGNSTTQTIHMRTAVLMTFQVPDNEALAPPSEAKRKVTILGPDGRPV